MRKSHATMPTPPADVLRARRRNTWSASATAPRLEGREGTGGALHRSCAHGRATGGSVRPEHRCALRQRARAAWAATSNTRHRLARPSTRARARKEWSASSLTFARSSASTSSKSESTWAAAARCGAGRNERESERGACARYSPRVFLGKRPGAATPGGAECLSLSLGGGGVRARFGMCRLGGPSMAGQMAPDPWPVSAKSRATISGAAAKVGAEQICGTAISLSPRRPSSNEFPADQMSGWPWTTATIDLVSKFPLGAAPDVPEAEH